MLFDFGQQSNVQWSAVLTGGSTNANANGSAIDCAGFSWRIGCPYRRCDGYCERGA